MIRLAKSIKETHRALSHFEQLFTLTSAATICVSVSVFVSLVGVFVGTASSTIGLKFVQ